MAAPSPRRVPGCRGDTSDTSLPTGDSVLLPGQHFRQRRKRQRDFRRAVRAGPGHGGGGGGGDGQGQGGGRRHRRQCGGHRGPGAGLGGGAGGARAARGAGDVGRHAGAAGGAGRALPGELQQRPARRRLGRAAGAGGLRRVLPAPRPLRLPLGPRPAAARARAAGRAPPDAGAAARRGRRARRAARAAARAPRVPPRHRGGRAARHRVHRPRGVPGAAARRRPRPGAPRLQRHVLPGRRRLGFLHPALRDARAQDPVLGGAPADHNEDGAKNAVTPGQRLGPRGLCDFLQTGDGSPDPPGQISAGSGEIPAPGGGGQRAGVAENLRHHRHQGLPDPPDPVQRGDSAGRGDRGEDCELPAGPAHCLYREERLRSSWEETREWCCRGSGTGARAAAQTSPTGHERALQHCHFHTAWPWWLCKREIHGSETIPKDICPGV